MAKAVSLPAPKSYRNFPLLPKFVSRLPFAVSLTMAKSSSRPIRAVPAKPIEPSAKMPIE